jgi:signal transduction histidine kinase
LETGATLYIEDNGPGIDDNDIEKVFDRGYRGSQHINDVEGSGLGLGMSKMIIQKMGGSLDILKDGPSHLGGATIRIILFRDPSN